MIKQASNIGSLVFVARRASLNRASWRLSIPNPVINRTYSVRMSLNENLGDVSTEIRNNKAKLIARELVKKRLEKKVGKQSLGQNTASLQIIGTHTHGFNPSILVHSEGRSYLFNCIEGTQRFCYANKIRLMAMENIFITNHCWQRVSGTVGLSLTLQDAGATQINIKSADGIQDFFNSTNKFMHFNTGIKCGTSTHLDGGYEDGGITIEAIPIEPETKISSSLDGASNSCLKRLKSSSRLIAYSCKLPDLRGQLDAQKCKLLGVPVGRQLGLLKSGQDIKLGDGTIVKSADVCGEKLRGLRFLVIECPSKSYIEKLKSNPALQNFTRLGMQMNDEGQQMDLVVHFSPAEVANEPSYVDWVNGFENGCKHLFLFNNELAVRPNILDSYRMHYLLRQLDDQLFPPLRHLNHLDWNVKETEEERESVVVAEDGNDAEKELMEQEEENCFTMLDYDKDLGRIFHLESVDKITFRPRKSVGVVRENVELDSTFKLAKRAAPQFEHLFTQLKESQKNFPQPKNYEPEVVFMGTGSAIPSKYRNTSFILVNFTHPNPASVILDCGEDAYGQLLQYYGSDETKRVLKQLKLIYVSHHHADHHIGLIRLLLERKKLTQEPLQLLLPPGIEELLNYHNNNFDDLTGAYDIFSTIQLKAENSSFHPDTPPVSQLKSSLLERLNHLLEDVQTIPVLHCFNSFAVLFKFKIGHPEMETFSLAYSGDARPSESFANIARGCDLLIHEATFDHRLTDEAINKRHSTSTEAIKVGKIMDAKFTVLTHFSQRLSKAPYFTPEFDDKVGFAFDYLTLKCPSQFNRLPILKPILCSVFEDFFKTVDAKYSKMVDKQKAARELIKSVLE